VAVDVRPHGDGAEIVVRDTGGGMSAEILRHVGSPFFTTREEGSGIGVAIARSVAARHGGRLEYASAPGDGTTVTMSLPRERVR
jgi:signal transduction histidine kinase